MADGKLYLQEAHKIQKIGTIEVQVFHRNVEKKKFRATFEHVEEVGIVSEKGLMGRALSHSVGYLDSFWTL